ncbi:hypothetical protein CC2G_000015 [Coprinopsis cinerea AmutBmut pab1-1]|nr:hypothetical protein CC2G_000015 [Coprinopsis cinerea AmutBmut pab1-1]
MSGRTHLTLSGQPCQISSDAALGYNVNLRLEVDRGMAYAACVGGVDGFPATEDGGKADRDVARRVVWIRKEEGSPAGFGRGLAVRTLIGMRKALRRFLRGNQVYSQIVIDSDDVSFVEARSRGRKHTGEHS